MSNILHILNKLYIHVCDVSLSFVSPSGFSQSGMGGTMGSSMPPFQTSMSSTLGQTGIVSAMDTQKSSGLFGMENKTTSNTSGSSPFKSSDVFSSGGPGIHSLDHSTGIRNRVGCMFHCMLGAVGEGGVSQEKEERGGSKDIYSVVFGVITLFRAYLDDLVHPALRTLKC